jgi:hypothetical protein
MKLVPAELAVLVPPQSMSVSLPSLMPLLAGSFGLHVCVQLQSVQVPPEDVPDDPPSAVELFPEDVAVVPGGTVRFTSVALLSDEEHAAIEAPSVTRIQAVIFVRDTGYSSEADATVARTMRASAAKLPVTKSRISRDCAIGWRDVLRQALLHATAHLQPVAARTSGAS